MIVLDPPWPMQKIERDVKPEQVAFDYPTMSEEELAAMPIPAADDCHVWVWTTHNVRELPDACIVAASFVLERAKEAA